MKLRARVGNYKVDHSAAYSAIVKKLHRLMKHFAIVSIKPEYQTAHYKYAVSVKNCYLLIISFYLIE
jgi:hypothetical protein